MVHYLKGIATTLRTVFEGLSITLSYLIRKPLTIQYPDKIDQPVQDTLPLRYRGHLEVDVSICTDCKACERVCPISCIAIDSDKGDGGQRWISRFDIDLAKCMYCGLCSEACPTGSIRHSQEFEGACANPAAMVRHFVFEGQPVPAFKPKKEENLDSEVSQRVERGKEFMDLFAQPG
jgi:formate hydrogenlyase subunit 6/NADH:ubiquinone oxidoreductase subunit I